MSLQTRLQRLLAALLLVALLQRPHGFFATPILIVPTFIGAGLCGVIGVHALWRRRALSRGLGADASALAVFAAGLLVFGVILALCSFGSVGMGYLALWWVGPGAIVLIISMLIPRLRTALWLASLAIGAASFVHLYVLLIPAVVAMSGQAPLPPPADVKVAMLSWLLVVGPVALGGMAAAHRAGGLRIALYVCLCIAGLGIAATALRVPYTEARPKRIFATHAEKDGKAALLLMSMDLLPLDAALAGIPEAQAVAAGEDWPHSQLPPGWLPPYSHKLPAAPLDTPPPRLEILSRTEDAARGMGLGTHGSTYGGNPLACAVGVAVMDIVTAPGFLEQVSRTAGRFRQGLEGLVASHPAIFGGVRGEGLMLALECRVPNGEVVKAGYGAHVLVVAGGDNVVRLLPPLTLSEAEVDEGLRRLGAAAVALEREAAGA